MGREIPEHMRRYVMNRDPPPPVLPHARTANANGASQGHSAGRASQVNLAVWTLQGHPAAGASQGNPLDQPVEEPGDGSHSVMSLDSFEDSSLEGYDMPAVSTPSEAAPEATPGTPPRDQEMAQNNPRNVAVVTTVAGEHQHGSGGTTDGQQNARGGVLQRLLENTQQHGLSDPGFASVVGSVREGMERAHDIISRHHHLTHPNLTLIENNVRTAVTNAIVNSHLHHARTSPIPHSFSLNQLPDFPLPVNAPVSHANGAQNGAAIAEPSAVAQAFAARNVGQRQTVAGLFQVGEAVESFQQGTASSGAQDEHLITPGRMEMALYCRHVLKVFEDALQGYSLADVLEREFKDYIKQVWVRWVRDELTTNELYGLLATYVRHSVPEARHVDIIGNFRIWYDGAQGMHHGRNLFEQLLNDHEGGAMNANASADTGAATNNGNAGASA